ncbi:M1 family metallopeptidase [Pedobacter immunditicola]|uniref:M1 family metallopeptidase n=1 Tax=Pedobacter immunditicola TaxID=3133440 RepID=UPI0030B31803
MKRLKVIFLLILVSAGVFAQQSLQIPPEIQNAYNAGTRSPDGKPGPLYWQNTADYDIKVLFDPATRLLKGKVEINYVNNSPDSLKQLWFKLYPNIYKKGVPIKAKINARDLGEGVKLTALTMGGKTVATTNMTMEGTNMYTNIAALPPGDSLKINITYSYILNKGSHVRTGQVDEGSYFIAYFFPRIAVYDDIDGWNKYPYTGDEEFYNDFCNFKAELTVPKDYVVWATGDLTNANQVFQETVAGRLKKAESEDHVIDVITPLDLANKKVTKGRSAHTWKYEAKNVTDFVFALSDHYVWKSSSLVVDSLSGRRTRVDAVYNPSHKDDYEEVIQFARQTVAAMSFKFPKWPFPYSHETIFDGLDQMEYPMMVNDNPVQKREDAITLTVHEIFHTMFPFYLGTNETKYGWMDEGWATMGEWLISPLIDTSMVNLYGVAQTGMTSGTKNDSPIITLTPELKGSGSFTSSYPKPGMGYLFVKDYLGDALFTKALHHYISQWQGKHPMPYDFFNSMNEGSGKNLNWFWQRWFFEEGVTDMAIAGVNRNEEGYAIQIQNKSDKPMPVHLTLEYADGSTTKIQETIGIWEKGDSLVTIQSIGVKNLKRVVLGGSHVPDKNSRDNTFNVKNEKVVLGN